MSNRRLDTPEKARDVEATSIEHPHAEAIATRGDIERLEFGVETMEGFARLEAKIAVLPDKADLYRALWIHGACIVGTLAALEFLV